MAVNDSTRGPQDAARALAETASPAPPAGLDDPVAERTSWAPLKPGGANFRTHRLVEVSPTLLRFAPTVGALLFAGTFLLAGLGVASIGLSQGLLRTELGWEAWPTIPFGALFAAVGALLLRSFSRGAHFDRQRGLYWRGGAIAPEPAAGEPSGDDAAVRLREVHALQLLSERCSSSNSRGRRTSYLSYELNLVLRNGQRLNVTDHGAGDRLREDAQRLARFLGRPLWDVSQGAGPETRR